MKKIVITTLVVCLGIAAMAQDETPGYSKHKLFTGGSFGLSFGSYTFLNLAPQIGYRFNKYLAAGTGINLLYISQKEKDVSGNDYRKIVQGITGLNVFGRFYPIKNFMLQLQPEENYKFGKQVFYQPTKETYKLDTEIVPSVLVGGGLVFPDSRGALLVSLMYDVLQDPNSPYGKRPVFNIGYNIHL